MSVKKCLSYRGKTCSKGLSQGPERKVNVSGSCMLVLRKCHVLLGRRNFYKKNVKIYPLMNSTIRKEGERKIKRGRIEGGKKIALKRNK